VVLNWIALIFSLAALVYVLTHSKQLAARPRRGTEWTPSQRTWLVVGGVGASLALIGSLINLIGDQ